VRSCHSTVAPSLHDALPIYISTFSAGTGGRTQSARTGNIVVALDPGHDANDAGAQGYGLREEVLTLKIAEYCKAELEEDAGVSRSEEHTSELQSRFDIVWQL